MLKPIRNIYRADFDMVADSFIADINIRNICDFPMISIYFNPKDYPGKYVARVFDIRPGEVRATRYIMIRENLEDLRNAMPQTFTYMAKTQEDEPELVEVWM